MSINLEQMWELGASGQANERTLQNLYRIQEASPDATELQVCISRVELDRLDAYSAINRAAEALAGLSNDSPWSARALSVLAQGYSEMGHAKEGLHFATEASQVVRPEDRGHALLATAHAYSAADRFDEACLAAAEGIKEFSAMGQHAEVVAATVHLGTIRKDMGQPSAAARAFEIAGRHLHPSQMQQRMRVEGLHASTCAPPDQRDMRLMLTSVAYAEEHQYGRALLDHYGDFSDMLGATGDHKRAEDIAKKLTSLAASAGIIRAERRGHVALSNSYQAQGEHSLAQIARQMARQVGPSLLIADTTRVQHTLIQLRKLHQQVVLRAA